MCLSSYLPNLRDLFTLNAPAASYIIYESIFEIYDFKTQENNYLLENCVPLKIKAFRLYMVLQQSYNLHLTAIYRRAFSVQA